MESRRHAAVLATVRLDLACQFAGRIARRLFFLAVLETIALLGLFVSLLRGEFLPGKSKSLLKLSLIYSLFVFVILSFGSRLTDKLDIAAINLLYFLSALGSFREVAREEP